MKRRERRKRIANQIILDPKGYKEEQRLKEITRIRNQPMAEHLSEETIERLASISSDR